MQNNNEQQSAPMGAGTGASKFESELLSRKEAARYLGVTEQTLAIWKTTQRYNLPVVKIGRLAKYRKADLDAFILSRLQTMRPQGCWDRFKNNG